MSSRSRTIPEAICEVLRGEVDPLRPDEIYDRIVARGLYEFGAKNPQQVVRQQLRRHCKDISFPSARSTKLFALADGGRYVLLDQPVEVSPSLYEAEGEQDSTPIVVSVPDDDEAIDSETGSLTHSDVQHELLALGVAVGLQVWAPRNDRNRVTSSGGLVGAVQAMLEQLPLQFDAPTMKTVENIDVLWVDGGAIAGAFEIEHTTSIYSGLLRMSDLVAMQPNIMVDLYLVAPDDRADKFAREIVRPTFAKRKRPLHQLCRFLPYARLYEAIEATREFLPHLRPDFLKSCSYAYDPTSEVPDDDA